MANYFLDTEFLEGTQKTFFGKTKPTIDLISIGLASEDGRSYYAISNEFNLKEAWNRWDKSKCCNLPELCGSVKEGHCEGFKREYWIRDNVLRSIHEELSKKENYARQFHPQLILPFSYKSMKTLIKWHGKSNIEIANDICAFVYGDDCGGSGMSALEMAQRFEISDKSKEPVFHAYFGDYDWVAFCWLFGKMISLPKGFPMYCIDLKQTMDEKARKLAMYSPVSNNIKAAVAELKKLPDYPFHTGTAHNSKDDAEWNLELYKFLQKL